MPFMKRHRILFIDAHDSFTNNIVSLLECTLRAQVTVIHNDAKIDDFPAFTRSFTAVVAGPGPGDPRNAQDVGLFSELWRLEGDDVLPVLGICLGFQSLVHAFGGRIERLAEPRHGVVRIVLSNGKSIFQGVDVFKTVQYHSLHAVIEGDGKNGLPHPIHTPELQPLAYDVCHDGHFDGPIEASPLRAVAVLMAVQHSSRPFYGIQFHPESICSSKEARQVISNWWDQVVFWHRQRILSISCASPDRALSGLSGNRLLAGIGRSMAKENQLQRLTFDAMYMQSSEPCERQPKTRWEWNEPPNFASGCIDNGLARYSRTAIGKDVRTKVISKVIVSTNLTVRSICESLGLTDRQSIILDSEKHQKDEVGENSIIGLISTLGSLSFEYYAERSILRKRLGCRQEDYDLKQWGGNVFSYLKCFMNQYTVTGGNDAVPFWGGLVGYISYEACLETIDVPKASPPVLSKGSKVREKPDLCFVFVKRSIVFNHLERKIHIQSLIPDDQIWLEATAITLLATAVHRTYQKIPQMPSYHAKVLTTKEETYKTQINYCQDKIRAGDAYELCLTTQTIIRTTEHLPWWPLYLRLRKLNPSPFAALLRLGGMTLVSSSPERFLRWTRPSVTDEDMSDNSHAKKKSIKCQFRPIKGTVKKRPDPNRPSITLEEATALLSTAKERAENLMIVDLIRHDLYGVVGSGRVHVPKLMVVEEYATVFQLVSVIEGTLIMDDSDDNDGSNDNSRHSEIKAKSGVADPAQPKPSNPDKYVKSGIDILAASLPPGSMTGAPKVRSCQILQDLEMGDRGVYSGVVGYIDVGGGGDFSVVIRSAVRWDDDCKCCDRENDSLVPLEGEKKSSGLKEEKEEAPKHGDTWHIAAGGAVTALSTEDGEWEEMRAKMKSTLRLFEIDP